MNGLYKKRYCINIGMCITLPLTLPLGWLVFLLCFFLVTFFVSLAKGESVEFFNSILESRLLWLYLSGPISIAAAVLVTVGFIVFPISYVEVESESMRVHRAFKRDRVVKYDEIFFVRLNPKRKKEWASVFFVTCAGGEINTIEVRKKYPFPSFWFSSSRRAYDAISEKLRAALSRKNPL